MDETFLVITPGSFTTVQDRGRYGFQKIGVPVSGAVDFFASRVANILAGNGPDAAVLEMTVVGCTLAVLKPAWVALTGADAVVKHNGKPLSLWRGFQVNPGDLLSIDKVRQGCRVYMAVAGGFDVPVVMGSRSTNVQAGLGGHHGRPLQKGDFLPVGEAGPIPPKASAPAEHVPDYASEIVLRCIPGPQNEFFVSEGRSLYDAAYSVSAQADRRGIRLEGPRLEHVHGSPGGVISEPSLPGNIQVPGDGQPIVLLLEQTVGGYAKIGSVISSDIWKLGQVIPGSTVRFEEVDLQAANDLAKGLQERFEALEAALWSP
jgi:biotin-dependent carboxylase-like uncharacterized protein